MKKSRAMFTLYGAVILIATVGVGTYFAASDPLTVVNNLSEFIFSLIRAIGFLTLAGGIIITFTKEILALITG